MALGLKLAFSFPSRIRTSGSVKCLILQISISKGWAWGKEKTPFQLLLLSLLGSNKLDL